MLRELHIRNFSIIDDATLEFTGGFNVITGETGAGKSIIIHSLSLALGERASGDVIRSGAKEAVIEAFFDIPLSLLNPSARDFLQDNGIDISEGLILKRIISAQGKNRAYINGSMATVQNLYEISRNMVDIHGQYEHQSLLSTDKQMELIDIYGRLVPERTEVENIYDQFFSIRHRISELSEKDKERAQRIDILKFQINEIAAADLSVEEEQQLEEESRILSNAGRLAELAHEAYELVHSSDASCTAALSRIFQNLKEISDVDPRADEAVNSVGQAMPLLEETGNFLRDYKDSIEFDPQRLEKVQERLELIKNLRRKYGKTVNEVINYKIRAESELETLRHSEETMDSLKTEEEEVKKRLTEKAGSLSKKRKSFAKKLESEAVSKLSGLSMPHTKFSVHVSNDKGDDTADGFKAYRTGIDNIEFLISPNPGEDLKPLQKIASGGELSRIMLTLKGILAGGDNIPVMVFDEIDAGIGGKTADNVAKKMKALSKNHQVICITHLPQIASHARGHLKIEKKIKKNRTVVEIKKVEKQERTAEVARMLSGEITDVSIRHAEEMLKKVGD